MWPTVGSSSISTFLPLAWCLPRPFPSSSPHSLSFFSALPFCCLSASHVFLVFRSRGCCPTVFVARCGAVVSGSFLRQSGATCAQMKGGLSGCSMPISVTTQGLAKQLGLTIPLYMHERDPCVRGACLQATQDQKGRVCVHNAHTAQKLEGAASDVASDADGPGWCVCWDVGLHVFSYRTRMDFAMKNMSVFCSPLTRAPCSFTTGTAKA